jgi:hypothetical protein
LPGLRRPAARSATRRSAHAGPPSPSDDGGLEELEEFLPRRRSSSATRASRAALAVTSLALATRSSAITVAWTATVASRSASGEGIAASWTTSGQARLPWASLHSYTSSPPTVKPAAAGRRPEQLPSVMVGLSLAGRPGRWSGPVKELRRWADLEQPYGAGGGTPASRGRPCPADHGRQYPR